MFDLTDLCFGTRNHKPHNVDVTLTHHCAGYEECGKGNTYDHLPHSITKLILVHCDGEAK